MSYLVLARKCRPQKFPDVVGQKAVVRILQNALKRQRVAHAMIFSGVRGVGKTTLARIMAKAINCHNPAEAPCDHCSSCLEIKAGNAIDLHEIDGASNRGIQEIRELKENLRFLPTREKFKIIIIDEVHMLTTEAFNALLKTLEEPPEHVFFMFATTELYKVPITILSRCQRYELKRIPLDELVSFFASIAEQEGINVTPAALEIIAREADGSVRDGLSLLDQIFSFGGETVTDEDLAQVLGLVDNRIFAQLAAALLAVDLAGALSLLNDSYGQGMNMQRFTRGLLQYFRALLICKTCRSPELILDISEQEMTCMCDMSSKYSFETLSYVFDLLFKGIEGMKHSSYPRMALEMIFIKVVRVGEIAPVSDLLGRLDSLMAMEPAPVVAKEKPSVLSPASLRVEAEGGSVGHVDDTRPHHLPKSVKADSGEVVKSEEKAVDTPSVVPVRPANSTVSPLPESKALRRDWNGFVAHVKDRKKWMASALELSEKAMQKDGELIIKFDDSSECRYLQEMDNVKLLTEFAQDFFQKELVVKIVAQGGEGTCDQGMDKPQEDRRALARDPRVEMALEILGGQVARIRTGPRSR